MFFYKKTLKSGLIINIYHYKQWIQFYFVSIIFLVSMTFPSAIRE